MPKVRFMPGNIEVEVTADTKLLAAATTHKVPIRFGCGACRCGTCGIAVDHGNAELSPIMDQERAMLERLDLPTDGSVRMACRTRIISGECVVDLEFQDTYDPPPFPA